MLTQRKALVLVTLVLFCCALLDSRWTNWLTGPVAQAVNTLQRPADEMASLMRQDPPMAYEGLSDQRLEELLEKARKENEALWSEIDKLNEQLASFRAIQDIRDIESVRLVEARVSRYNNDAMNPTVMILRGSLHGLEPDDAVAHKTNLVGFVTESIGPANAMVSLITRKGFSIGVQIKPPPNPDKPNAALPPGWPYKTRVTSDGRGAFYVDLKKSIADGLRPGDYVRAEDTVRESATGFLLGLIEKVEPVDDDPLNLSRVTIKPRVPIGPQRRVTVLTERTD